MDTKRLHRVQKAIFFFHECLLSILLTCTDSTYSPGNACIVHFEGLGGCSSEVSLSYPKTSLPYLAFVYAEQDIVPDGPVLLQYRLHFSDHVFTKNISTLEKRILNALLKHLVLLVFPKTAVLCCSL